MLRNNQLNYVEFAAKDLIRTKTFFEQVFQWQFTDYGPDYTAFSNQGLDGGFYQADLSSRSTQGAALLIIYANNLEQSLHAVTLAGGTIVKPIFNFPGGRRFHFLEPSGNELAVWSEL